MGAPMTITFDVEAPTRETATIFAPRARTFRVVPVPDRHETHRFDIHADYPEDRPQLLSYAAARARELIAQGGLAPRTAVRALQTLAALAMPEAVFPHISAADGEFVALWLAGRSTIELSMPEDGEIYVRTTVADSTEDLLGFYGTIPVAALRARLRALSDAVENSNPNWRRVFEK